jgi:regulator of RNase E activity RraA
LRERFSALSTALVADACVRLAVPMRLAPVGIRPVTPGTRVAGRALPARHYGSVDIFLEALEGATAGDVLVVDNGGRDDEGCVGDLVALEAQAAGLAGIVIWGLHRDTAELRAMQLPIFSYGSCPAGPLRVDPPDADALIAARCGTFTVGRDDVVFADDDGVLFAPAERIDDLLAQAGGIAETERRQAELVRAGSTLRAQLRFADYLARRAANPAYTFRQHLRAIGGAIEE